jgi:replicative DNA helicase
MVLHQLTKECERRDDKRPTLGDLRYVGEAEARAVWFLYRDFVYNKSKSETSAEVIVAKNNNGSTGTVEMYAELSRMCWGDMISEHANADYRGNSTSEY